MYFKVKIIPFILNETMPFLWTHPSPKTGLQNEKNSSYLTEVQRDISDLCKVQNKDYQY